MEDSDKFGIVLTIVALIYTTAAVDLRRQLRQTPEPKEFVDA
ncbi:hypothetical protein ACFTWF_39145 [Rhodococcus sp. NPDC056960]